MFHNKPEWQRRADEYLESLIVPDAFLYREQVYRIFQTSHDKESLQLNLTRFKKEIANV
jgi:hypothetical protein